MSSTDRRIHRESETIQAMIRIFCRDRHGIHAGLCSDCEKLLAYADARLERCPFGADKPTCNRCPVHCYKPLMRKRIREVMRHAGPRMLSRHPLLAVRHMLDGLKSVKKVKES